MTTATVKTSCFTQKIYKLGFGLSPAIAILIMLWSCTATNFNVEAITWKTYSNSRYGFEFPYPSNWTSLAAPENDDGIGFISPENKTVEIRGWASQQLLNSIDKSRESRKKIQSNFQTAQGISGVLVVEVDRQATSMTLTLTQNQVKYYWQGRSNSQEFPNYYRFFYYIAQQYRIPKS
ncbi:hypothetical protein NIES25_34720 [Nostoc linckia NIES-25]|nr:hypothetical protein NIES25_34720 [Nostoc linckia NIES-25]